MFDSHPGSAKAFVVGGGRPAAKLSLDDPTGWRELFGQSEDGAAARMRNSPHTAFTRQGWFRKCADARAKAVSTLPWAIYDAGADNDADPLWKNDDVATPDDLAVLSGLGDALYLAEAALALCGQFYFGRRMLDAGQRIQGSRLGRFAGLAYWSPLAVTPRFDLSLGHLTHFDRTAVSQSIAVDPDAVIWAWQPDPFVEIGPGSSDGMAAAHSAAVLDAMARFLGDHLDGGLIKMTVLATKDGSSLSKEQAGHARSLWSRFLRGFAFRDEGPPVLNGVEPHTIGEGLKELANEVLTKEQREAIATGFGIPWSVLMASAANYATAEVEERGFYLRTVIPQSALIARALNEHLFEEYGLTFRFEPERHEVMQQYELTKAEQIQKVCGRPVLLRNEGRELLGFEPVDGWDEEDRTAPAPSAPVPPARSVDRPAADPADTLGSLSAEGFDALIKMIS